MIVGIGEIFHEPDTGPQQRPDHDTRQHQEQDWIACRNERADQIDGRDRGKPAQERKALDTQDAEREIDAEHCAERRARRGSKNVRRYQRVAKQALKRGAGNRERGADQHGRDDARSAHLQNHVLDRARHARRTPGELRGEHVDHVRKSDRVTPERECEREARQ